MTRPRMNLWLDAEIPFDVQHVVVDEGLDRLFAVDVVALAKDTDLDLDAVVGEPARVTLEDPGVVRHWTGIVAEAEVVHATRGDAATYRLLVVPPLWLLTQRSNYRIYQYRSEIEIVLLLLREWDIHPIVEVDLEAHPRRKYRVQYGETDFAFVARLLEEAGVSFSFRAKDGHTYLVLRERPQDAPPRSPLHARDDLAMSVDAGWARSFARGVEVRPGSYRVRDRDLRVGPDVPLLAEAEIPANIDSIEGPMEVYEHEPGVMQTVAELADTPAADDRGAARTDERHGAAVARRRLEAMRCTRDVVSFESNVLDLAPGDVVPLLGASGPQIPGDGEPLLVIASRLEVSRETATRNVVRAVAQSVPWRPERVTAKPVASGVESATVVGPRGEEIYTDEFGRVRVSFHWDRESKYDETSSCWLPVSQPWAGAGYGGSNLPRIGQEVLVDFENGDPDRPMVTGRVYTNHNKVPYKLPESATESGWRSNSTGGKKGFSELRLQDAGGAELFSMQAERDYDENILRDDTQTIKGTRAIRVRQDESHTVVGLRSIHATGRIDEENLETDEVTTVSGLAVTSDTTIFLDPARGLDVGAKTILLEGKEIAFASSGLVFFEVDSTKAEIAGQAAEGTPQENVNAGGYVALMAALLDINPGVAVPGDRPITDAEKESDLAWADEERAHYDAMSDEELANALQARRWAGKWGVRDVGPQNPLDRFATWKDQKLGNEEGVKAAKEWRQGAIDTLVGISASERELQFNRPISPVVRNRYPRPTMHGRPRDLRRGKRKSEQ